MPNQDGHAGCRNARRAGAFAAATQAGTAAPNRLPNQAAGDGTTARPRLHRRASATGSRPRAPARDRGRSALRCVFVRARRIVGGRWSNPSSCGKLSARIRSSELARNSSSTNSPFRDHVPIMSTLIVRPESARRRQQIHRIGRLERLVRVCSPRQLRWSDRYRAALVTPREVRNRPHLRSAQFPKASPCPAGHRPAQLGRVVRRVVPLPLPAPATLPRRRRPDLARHRRVAARRRPHRHRRRSRPEGIRRPVGGELVDHRSARGSRGTQRRPIVPGQSVR